jgi:hypothetical protein
MGMESVLCVAVRALMAKEQNLSTPDENLLPPKNTFDF